MSIIDDYAAINTRMVELEQKRTYTYRDMLDKMRHELANASPIKSMTCTRCNNQGWTKHETRPGRFVWRLCQTCQNPALRHMPG